MKTPACAHLSHIHSVTASGTGCTECVEMGARWVHLRECLECGHVGCCDSSEHTHATKHYLKSKHPIMHSIEPGESWKYCYIDELMWE